MKVLRALLHKKIYPRSSTSISTNKYLENKEEQTRDESEMEEKETDRCKWVKTDSECKSTFLSITTIDV
jgi:hypothetical protein